MSIGSHTTLSRALRGHVRSPRYLIWAAVLLATSIALALLPLFDSLGYAFALAMAIVASLASLDLGAAFVRRLRHLEATALERSAEPGGVLVAMTLRAALASAALLVAPLALILLNGLRSPTCDRGFGLLAYLLLPGMSSLLATSIGILCGLAAGQRRKLALALPYLVFLASALHSLRTFYATPPIFSYNLFAGYFPGNLYDEQIVLGPAFFAARLYHVALLAALGGAAALLLDVPTLSLSLRGPRRPWGRRSAAFVTATAAGLTALLLRLYSGELGFSIAAEDIQKALGGRFATEHFVIYFPRGGRIEERIGEIAEEHEFRYAQVVQTLGARPEGKITSFYFANAEDKFRWMGARRVDMAKPWRNEIYVHDEPFPHPVLRHEIAHVVAGSFGDPVFAVSAATLVGLPILVNPGLIEGTAVAVDWTRSRHGDLTLHQAAKAMRNQGVAPPLEGVFGLGFLAFASARSYTAAGSFVRYLLDEFGAVRLRVLYRTGGDFQRAYGRPLAELEAGWRALLDATDVAPHELHVARERFRTPSVFDRPCAVDAARRLARGGELRARGQRERALALVQSLREADPNEPQYRLVLASLLRELGRAPEAAAVYESLAADKDAVTPTIRGRALLLLADLALQHGDATAGSRHLERALTLPLDEDTERNVVARRWVLDQRGPARDPLHAYFWKVRPLTDPDPALLVARAAAAVIAEPELALGHYLLGLQLGGRGAAAQAQRSLGRALELGLPHPLLSRAAALHLVAAAYLAGDLETSQRAAALLAAPDQPAATRLVGRDWLERIAWKQAR